MHSACTIHVVYWPSKKGDNSVGINDYCKDKVYMFTCKHYRDIKCLKYQYLIEDVNFILSFEFYMYYM